MRLVMRLSQETGLLPADVARIISTAPVRYKRFPIRKRNGGTRVIAQPAREVKMLQRAFVDYYLRELPIHEAAMAYRPNFSIKDNASAHAGGGPILKMDFSDFFTSIKSYDWVKFCQANSLFDEALDSELSAHLLFHRVPGVRSLRLAIGAPSSPIVSNLLMREFDEMISAAVAEEQVVYTRYADDLTFSSKRTGYLQYVPKMVKQILRKIEFPKLEVNASKTVTVTSRYSRSVTGLVLTNDGKVTIGRDRKRLIRSMINHFQQNKMEEKSVRHLQGLVAFAAGMEPEYVVTLRLKYGTELIDKILRSNSYFRKDS